MSPEALTAERIHRDIKAEILRGDYAPGLTLNVHAMAKRHEMSISPVRDGLQRLVGERLLLTRPAGGFEVPLIEEEEARDLYQWHDRLARWAIGRSRPRGRNDLLALLDRLDPGNGAEIAALTTEVFYRIGEAAGNVEHILAIRSAGERLGLLRIAESVLRDRKVELRRLWLIAHTADAGAIRNAVSVYHRRRFRNLMQIVAAQRRVSTY